MHFCLIPEALAMISYKVPASIQKYLEHDLILQYTELPKFPAGRAGLLRLFLQSATDSPESLRELYPMATSLVQVALDTHDLVGEEREEGGKVGRMTQLRVLAGDYFSSRFYQLLAQAGQIDWIRHLAHAICELNRIKLQCYMRMKHLKMGAEEYVQSMVSIRSTLFQTFSILFENPVRQIWPEVLKAYTRCEVLADELYKAESAKHWKNSWSYWYILDQQAREKDRALLAETIPDEERLKELLDRFGIVHLLRTMLEESVRLFADKLAALDMPRLMPHLARELRDAILPFERLVNGMDPSYCSQVTQ
jgi:heptaprenyl diphosphate synthase